MVILPLGGSGGKHFSRARQIRARAEPGHRRDGLISRADGHVILRFRECDSGKTESETNGPANQTIFQRDFLSKPETAG